MYRWYLAPSTLIEMALALLTEGFSRQGFFKISEVTARRMFLALGLAPALLRAACEIRMTTGEKHSRGASGSPTEKEAKQAKPSASPANEAAGQHAEETEPKPSEREIKAALAARERLYGEKAGQKESEVTVFTVLDVVCT